MREEEEEEEGEEEEKKKKKGSLRSNGSKYDNQDDIGRENMPIGLIWTGNPPTDKTGRKKRTEGMNQWHLTDAEKKNNSRKQLKKKNRLRKQNSRVAENSNET